MTSAGVGGERRRFFVSSLLLASVLLAAVAAVVWSSNRDDDSSTLMRETSPPTTAQEASTTAVSELPSTTEFAPSSEGEASVAYDAAPRPDPTGSDDLPNSAPDSFWAITTETYELVQVDSRSGEILGRYGSWGPGYGTCEGEEGCLFQGLQSVQVASDGSLWLADCCEPAVGNIFSVLPGETFDPDGSFVTFGNHALLSPDGATIAYEGLGQLILADAAGDGSVAVLGEPAGSGEGPRYQPLEWVDDTRLLVRITGDVVDQLAIYDISDPADPRQVGPSMGGLISHTDAALRADGNVFALTRSYGGPDLGSESNLSAWVFDPETGQAIAETDLPDDVWEIDYDNSGTYLITVGADGLVRFFGAGRSGVLAQGFVSASW